MLTTATEFVCMALAAVAGIGFGWWFRSCTFTSMVAYDADPVAEDGMERATEVLSRLKDLAVRMASDVGEHSNKLQEASDELVAAGEGDSEAVLGAVARLLETNQKMQERLASAESRLQEQAQEIESYAAEARTDPLTELPNRRAFDAEIGEQFGISRQTGKPVCVTMIDVDHFKKFNDTYGHQAGDEVLVGVADVLRRHAGDQGMAARYGGEEFVLILPGNTIDEAETRVEQIRQAIADLRFSFSEDEVGVTASLGIAQLLGGENETSLIERADDALYAAKEAGRNRTWWHDGQKAHPVVANQHQAPPQPAANPSPRQPLPKTEPAEASVTRCRPPKAESKAASDEGPDGGQADTGHPNRMAFCTVLRHRLAEWKRGGPAPSVVLVRIDHFDRICQTQGQRVASLLMDVTARYLGAATRDGDVVGRYDETTFAVLLPGAGLANMIGIAERLRRTVAECKLSFDGQEHRFSISVGGAEVTHGDDSTSLLGRCEEALLASIKSGGNCGYFHNGRWSETVAAALERLQAT